MRLASSRLLSEQENLSSAVAALVKGRVPSLYQDHLRRAAPTQRRAQVQQKALVGPDRRRAAPPLASGPADYLDLLRGRCDGAVRVWSTMRCASCATVVISISSSVGMT